MKNNQSSHERFTEESRRIDKAIEKHEELLHQGLISECCEARISDYGICEKCHDHASPITKDSEPRMTNAEWKEMHCYDTFD